MGKNDAINYERDGKGSRLNREKKVKKGKRDKNWRDVRKPLPQHRDKLLVRTLHEIKLFVCLAVILFLFPGCGEEMSEVTIEVQIPTDQQNAEQISTLLLIVRDDSDANIFVSQEPRREQKATWVVTVERDTIYTFTIKAKNTNGTVIGMGMKTSEIRDDSASVEITLNLIKTSVKLNVSLPQSPLVEISRVILIAIDEMPVSSELSIAGSHARGAVVTFAGERDFTVEAQNAEGIVVALGIVSLDVPGEEPASVEITLRPIEAFVALDVQLPADAVKEISEVALTAIDGVPVSEKLIFSGLNATGTVAVPVGRQRTLLVEAKDSQGAVVSFGTTVLDVLLGSPINAGVEMKSRNPMADKVEITTVLRERWQKGYTSEDISLYLSAFWEEGFLYTSDMSTDDPIDDVIFDDIRQERDAASRVFEKFENIEMEISDPPEILFLNAEKTKAEVLHHYKIQGFVTEGLLEGRYNAWYAEGNNRFTFERISGEWRIAIWKDKALSPAEIELLDGPPPPPGGIEPPPKLLTTWGSVKER